MASFLIKRTVTKKRIVKITKSNNNYGFKPKSQNINKVEIKDPEFICRILTIKYGNALKKLIQKIRFVIQNGENDSETSGIMLNEINRYRSILLNKYAKYLKEKQVIVYLNILQQLELEIKSDAFNYNFHDEFTAKQNIENKEEYKGRRGK